MTAKYDKIMNPGSTLAMYQPMKLPKYTDQNRHESSTRQKFDHKTSADTSCQRNQHSNHEKERETPGQSREIKKVSRLVNCKLEHYFDGLKKEICFDVNGRYRTTTRLYQYDLMYKVAEAATLGKNKAKRKHKDTSGEKVETEPEESDVKINEPHSATQKGKGRPKSMSDQGAVKNSTEKRHIKPKLTASARCMTFPSEAKRITTYANDLWDSDKMRTLMTIHRYLPHKNAVVDDTEITTHVLPHSRHPAVVLHADYYVQHCAENGLYNGNPKTNPRLLKLRKKTVGEGNSGYNEKSSDCSNESRPKMSQKSRPSLGSSGEKKVDSGDKNETKTHQNRGLRKKTKSKAKSGPKNETKGSSDTKVDQQDRIDESGDDEQGDGGSRDDVEECDRETNQDDSNQVSYSDDFEDEKSTSVGDATSVYSYVSLVHAEYDD